MNSSYKRSHSYSYLAFSLTTRYQSMQDLLHVIRSNYICLECNILSFPISSTFNRALVSETWRPRAAAAYTLHRGCVIFFPIQNLNQFNLSAEPDQFTNTSDRWSLGVCSRSPLHACTPKGLEISPFCKWLNIVSCVMCTGEARITPFLATV